MWAESAPGSVTAAVLVACLLGGVLALAGAALFRLARRSPIAPADQALAAGILMLALILTAPISRVGYLIYPLSLLTLGLLLRETTPRSGAVEVLLLHIRRTDRHRGAAGAPLRNPATSPPELGAN
jgi:hypothetical protein